VGCDAVRWQGETTLRARAREKEQRGQRAAARLNRACSAWYKLNLAFEAKKVSIHAVLRGIRERPGEISGLANETGARPVLFIGPWCHELQNVQKASSGQAVDMLGTGTVQASDPPGDLFLTGPWRTNLCLSEDSAACLMGRKLRGPPPSGSGGETVSVALPLHQPASRID
jgi:hypothetical protein